MYFYVLELPLCFYQLVSYIIYDIELSFHLKPAMDQGIYSMSSLICSPLEKVQVSSSLHKTETLAQGSRGIKEFAV